MGIRGLNTCITRTTPESIKTVKWTDYENTCIGIDITCFLYRALASHLNPIDIIAAQLVGFKNLNVKPIYVFDGKAPQEKDIVVTKRRNDRNEALELCAKLKESLALETDISALDLIKRSINEIEEKNPVLTYEIKDEIKQFLYITGTTFVTASGEADSLLAYMFKRNIIDAIISLDLDFIARGTILLVPSHITCSPGGLWSQYDATLIRRGLRLSEDKFIDLCVLIGSDYTPDLTIVPWKTALTSLRSGDSISEIWARHTFSNWRRSDSGLMLKTDVDRLKKARNILLGLEDTADTLLDQVQWRKCLAPNYVETDGINLLRKKYPHFTNQMIDIIVS